MPQAQTTPPVSAFTDYDGPLGLLLQLVEDSQLDIKDISISTLTARYLGRLDALEHLSRHDLAEFVELGARLLYIKSLSLLPQHAQPETQPLQAVELRELERELTEYRRYKSAAQTLRTRLKPGHHQYGRSKVEQLPVGDLPMPTIDLTQLGRLVTAALARHRPAPPATIAREHYLQSAIVSRLGDQLHRGKLLMADVFERCRDRAEVIVTFLAVLELVRSGEAHLEQPTAFGPITLAGTHD